jgi:hypothetical protein
MIEICGTCMGRGWLPGHIDQVLLECPDCLTPWSGFANVTPEQARQAEIDCMKERA